MTADSCNQWDSCDECIANGVGCVWCPDPPVSHLLLTRVKEQWLGVLTNLWYPPYDVLLVQGSRYVHSTSVSECWYMLIIGPISRDQHAKTP